MKTTKRRKEKTVKTPKINSSIIGCAAVKKSINRSGEKHQRPPGTLPLSAAQGVSQQLPGRYALVQQTAKEVPKLEHKIELLPSEKIKLQLFPIDGDTRIELEKDGHIPFLELTLSARKKISSVLKHLNSKWGSSSIAIGDPVLFPYNIQLEKLNTYKRWTLNDNDICAGDVYAYLESPAFFRLRYGWFSDLHPKNVVLPSRSTLSGDGFDAEGPQKGCSTELTDDRSEKVEDFTRIRKVAEAVVTMNVYPDVPVDYVDDGVKIGDSLVPWDDSLTNLSIGGLLSNTSSMGGIHNCDPISKGSKLDSQPIQLFSSDISIGGLLSEASMQGKFDNRETKSPITDKGFVQPWEDGLTNLSIGGLLSEASMHGKIDICDPKSLGRFHPSQLISDSLDAFIAGQLSSQPQEAKPPSHLPQSSILDAEETCHGFPFRKFSSSTNSPNGEDELAEDPPHQESKTDLSIHLELNNGQQRSLGLEEIKWTQTESSGPFDLSLPASCQITNADGVSISKFINADGT